MKILFVYKGRYHIRDTVTIEYLSAIAKKYGHQTSLLYDLDLFGVTDNVFSISFLNRFFSSTSRTLNKILRSKPQLVVFLDGFARRQWNAEIASRLPFPAALLSYSKDESSPGAYAYRVYGEPEAAFGQFLEDRAYDSGSREFPFDAVADLEQLPLPDKTLFAPFVNFKDSYMVYTSKGCPYECSYCEETVYKISRGRRYYRRMSPGRVLQELVAAKRDFNMREVIFKDSVFALDKAWLNGFLPAYKKEVGVPFKCFGKSDVFDGEMALLLKSNGCYCVEFGAQNFNEGLKRKVLKRAEANEALIRAFSICSAHRVRYDIDHLFGVPGETMQDHLDAAGIYSCLKGLNRIKCHNLVFYQQAPISAFAPSAVKSNPAYNADFFSSVSGDKETARNNKAFQKYFRILPLLPTGLRRSLSKGSKWKIFYFLPGFLVVFLMLVLAIKNKDRRFWVYLRYYPKKVIAAFR